MSHLKELGKNLNSNSKYDNFIALGDLNAEPTNEALYDFCQVYGCSNIVKENTCYKNLENPSCIDLIITNRPRSFQGTKTIETGLEIKESETLDIFKNKIKQWIPLQCPCRLCLTYLPQIGFL